MCILFKCNLPLFVQCEGDEMKLNLTFVTGFHSEKLYYCNKYKNHWEDDSPCNINGCTVRLILA